MASLVITDGIERIVEGSDPMRISGTAPRGNHCCPRITGWPWRPAGPGRSAGTADLPASSKAKRLTGIRPLPSRRLAALDEFPDFFFHPRSTAPTASTCFLPAGEYEVTLTPGPEYLPRRNASGCPTERGSTRSSFNSRAGFTWPSWAGTAPTTMCMPPDAATTRAGRGRASGAHVASDPGRRSQYRL